MEYYENLSHLNKDYLLYEKDNTIKKLHALNKVKDKTIDDLICDRVLLIELMEKYNVTDEDKNKIFDNLKG